MPAPNGIDLVRAVQDRCRDYSHLVSPGSSPHQIRMYDSHGSLLWVLTLPDPRNGNGLVVGEVPPRPEPEAPHGWSFDGGRARFDGREVKIAGRKLDVLKALASSAKKSLSTDDLRREAWGNAEIEESTIRWYTAELRKDLKREFPDFPDDPLQSGSGGYLLLLK